MATSNPQDPEGRRAHHSTARVTLPEDTARREGRHAGRIGEIPEYFPLTESIAHQWAKSIFVHNLIGGSLDPAVAELEMNVATHVLKDCSDAWPYDCDHMTWGDAVRDLEVDFIIQRETP